MRVQAKAGFIGVKSLAIALFLTACGGSSPKPVTDPDDIPTDAGVTIRSFEVSGTNGALATSDAPALITLKEGSTFYANWSTKSGLPAFGTLFLSHTPDNADDRNAQQILITSCSFSGSCDWNAEAVCSVSEESHVTCIEKHDKVSKPSSIRVHGFQGDAYLVFEACTTLGCGKVAKRIHIR